MRIKAGSIFKVLILLLAVTTSLSLFFGYKYYTLKTDPQKIAKESARDIVSEVSKLTILPEEEPTIASVSDPEKLKSQPFFAGAKLGDKVLIYPKAQKAILYDPDKKVIINIAPLNLGN